MKHPCTCPEPISHIAELCDRCAHDYMNWLDDQAHEARIEALTLPTAAITEAA